MVAAIIPRFSFQPILSDALAAVEIGMAIVAGLFFIHLVILLPGLFSFLGAPAACSRSKVIESGSVTLPVMVGAALQRSSPESPAQPEPVARPHLWTLLSGCATPTWAMSGPTVTLQRG